MGKSILSFAVLAAIIVMTVYSRSQDATIRVYDAAGKMIEMYEHSGEIKE
jgi:hypothetical protein